MLFWFQQPVTTTTDKKTCCILAVRDPAMKEHRQRCLVELTLQAQGPDQKPDGEVPRTARGGQQEMRGAQGGAGEGGVWSGCALLGKGLGRQRSGWASGERWGRCVPGRWNTEVTRPRWRVWELGPEALEPEPWWWQTCQPRPLVKAGDNRVSPNPTMGKSHGTNSFSPPNRIGTLSVRQHWEPTRLFLIP